MVLHALRQQRRAAPRINLIPLVALRGRQIHVPPDGPDSASEARQAVDCPLLPSAGDAIEAVEKYYFLPEVLFAAVAMRLKQPFAQAP